MDKHLDFNTDFLNETVSPKTGSGQQPIAKKPGKSWNWKKILGISLGVYVLFAIIVSFSDDSTTSSSQQTQAPDASLSSTVEDDTVEVGTYRCSRSNHDKASQMQPLASELASLESTERDLLHLSDVIDMEKTELENAYVDEHSKYSVNLHNFAVDELNTKIKNWKSSVKTNSDEIDAYNTRVDMYNKFLRDNCTPR